MSQKNLQTFYIEDFVKIWIQLSADSLELLLQRWLVWKLDGEEMATAMAM